MKNLIFSMVVGCMLTTIFSSCSKPEPCWVQSTWYNEYVILNNGDTVTYEDGFVMSGMATGATKRQLTSEEHILLQNHLDTISRTTVDKFNPFVDQGERWREQDSITGKKHTLDYWMKFQNHTIKDEYKALTADDIKMVVCDYYHTYQTFRDDGERRLYYDIFN